MSNYFSMMNWIFFSLVLHFLYDLTSIFVELKIQNKLSMVGLIISSLEEKVLKFA